MSLEWNSECVMEGESGEQVGGELECESVGLLVVCAVTTTSIIISSNKTHNRHLLVLANAGPLAKIVTKMEK